MEMKIAPERPTAAANSAPPFLRACREIGERRKLLDNNGNQSDDIIPALRADLLAAKAEICQLRQELAKALSVCSQQQNGLTTDALTGLHNNAYLVERLKAAHGATKSRRSNGFSIFYMDLDGFKHLNDTLGHDIGDEILKTAGQLLKSCVRAEDTACRKGGDEFVLIFEGMSPSAALQKVQNIFQASSVRLKEGVPNPTFSIGVFHCRRAATQKYSPEEILTFADAALTGAKGRISKYKNTKMRVSWDKTLPLERQRATAADNHGHAAIALLGGGKKNLFITAIPDVKNPENLYRRLSNRQRVKNKRMPTRNRPARNRVSHGKTPSP